MAEINKNNYDKYKQLLKIYDTSYSTKKIKKEYPIEYNDANLRIYLSLALSMAAMVCGMVLFAHLLPLKLFLPLTATLIAVTTTAGVYKAMNALVNRNNLPIEVFKRENFELEIMPREKLVEELTKFEAKEKIKTEEYAEEKRLHQIPKEIGLDFKLASKKISTEEKIELLENEKAFWETALVEEQEKKKIKKL